MAERGVESLFGGSKRAGWDCSLVSEDRPYKLSVKSGGGQRESEGVVVVEIGVQNNAPGAKGPRFDRACVGRERQGMPARLLRANYPGGRKPTEPSASEMALRVPCPSVAHAMPRCRLWAAAKRFVEARQTVPAGRLPPGGVLSPEARWSRCRARKIIGKPCAGKPHARIERGIWKRARLGHRASDYQWQAKREEMCCEQGRAR